MITGQETMSSMFPNPSSYHALNAAQQRTRALAEERCASSEGIEAAIQLTHHFVSSFEDNSKCAMSDEILGAVLEVTNVLHV